MLQAPYEMQWRLDENGIPYSVSMKETVVIEAPYLSVVLEEIPDTFQRVMIEDITQDVVPIILGEAMSRTEVKNGKYYVDYNNGIIYFSEELHGRNLTIKYYGRGYKRINAKRIVGLELDSGMTIDFNSDYEERIAKLENSVTLLNKQIDLLIDELERRNY